MLALVAGVACGAFAMLAGAPLVGLLAVAGGWLLHRRAHGAARRATAGSHAEEDVARRLRSVGAAFVAFDVQLPGRRGDIDAVVLGPMAAAVEVKRAEGRVRFRRNGQVVVAGRKLPGRPLLQAVVQAAAVREASAIDGQVDAVLCVTGMRQRPRIVSHEQTDVWVTSARHLRKVLRRLPRELDRRAAASAAARLR